MKYLLRSSTDVASLRSVYPSRKRSASQRLGESRKVPQVSPRFWIHPPIRWVGGERESQSIEHLLGVLRLRHNVMLSHLSTQLASSFGFLDRRPPSTVMKSRRRIMWGWPPPGKRSLGAQHRGRLQSCVRPVDAVRMDCWP
jgi:hypothetical protein